MLSIFLYYFIRFFNLIMELFRQCDVFIFFLLFILFNNFEIKCTLTWWYCTGFNFTRRYLRVSYVELGKTLAQWFQKKGFKKHVMM